MTWLFTVCIIYGVYIILLLSLVLYVVKERIALHHRHLWPNHSRPEWSPYIHHDPTFSLKFILEMYLGAIFLAPIRIFYLSSSWLFYLIALKVIMFGVRLDFTGFLKQQQVAAAAAAASKKQTCPDSEFSLPPWARTAVINVGRWCSTVNLRGMGVTRVRVKGPMPAVTSAVTVVCNHNSYLDILTFMSILMPGFVAKRAIESVPGVGFMCKMAGGLFIDRETNHNPPLATNASPQEGKSPYSPTLTAAWSQTNRIITRQNLIVKYPENYFSLLVFPEGTTTNGKYLLPFRKGAFVSGLPVVPAVIRYGVDEQEAQPPSQHFIPTWESVNILLCFLAQLFRWKPFSIEVEFLPMYTPSAEEIENPQRYANNVAQLLSSHLRIPICTSTFKDKLDYFQFITQMTTSSSSSSASASAAAAAAAVASSSCKPSETEE